MQSRLWKVRQVRRFVFEAGREFHLGGAKRGRQPKKNGGRHGYRQCEHEDERINPDRNRQMLSWQRGSNNKDSATPVGKEDACSPASQREQNALCKKLSRQARAAGSESQAHTNLTGASGATREQETCNIGAGNQQ